VNDRVHLRAYAGHYFEFVVIGTVLVAFVTLGLSTLSQTIADEQRAGTLEMLLSAPTSLPALLAGFLVVPLGLTTVQVAVEVAAAIAIFGAHFPLSGLLLALPVLVLTVATFCAFGIFSASFIVLTKRGDPFAIFVAQASTLLAGALFPVSVLPGPLQGMARAVPAFYGLDAMRAAVLGNAGLGDVAGKLLVLAAFAAALLPLAVLAFSRALRAARVTGTLGNY